MLKQALFATAVVCSTSCLSPALAVDGEVVITQAKANAGSVTPGDAAGFPVTLSRGGKYKFGSNLVVPVNQDGILITAHNVTIDFNGFTLDGGNRARRGIVSVNGSASVTIQNGTIPVFLEDAIQGTGHSWTVEGMRITVNRGHGVSVGPHARIVGNTFSGNHKHAVWCGDFCHVEGNAVSSNGLSVAENNARYSAINAASGTVLGNTIIANAGSAIQTGSNSRGLGYGNNTIVGNNVGFASQLFGNTLPLHPNSCSSC